MILSLPHPEAMVLTLTVPKAEKWRLYAEGLLKPELDKLYALTSKIPAVWAEDKPPGLAGTRHQ